MSYIRINGKGKLTPVADAKTLVEIIWLLPGKGAREFRRSSSSTVCRVLGGDLSIVTEIEARHATLQATEGGRAAAQFLNGGEPTAAESVLAPGLPTELSLIGAEGRAEYFQLWMTKQRAAARREEDEHRVRILQKSDEVREGRARSLHAVHALMLELGGLDERDKLEFKDRARMIMAQQFVPSPVVGQSVVATPLLEAAVEVDDPTVPTPLCSASIRGPETSIHVVCSKIGITVGERAGMVGKAIKRLYIQRYGKQAADAIPKRNTIFRGKPFEENTYFTRDEDLIEAAIRKVMA